MTPTHRPAAGSLLAPREHAVVFGSGRASLAATAVEVFAAAHASGEALLFMTDDADPAVLDALPGRDALVSDGRLRVLRTADAYPHHDPVRLLAAFDDVLRGALADGWTGIRVVAENTSMVRGGDDAYRDWLAWEHVTAQWQARNPVVGVCWFDVTALDDDRIAELASVHAEHHGARARVPFRLLTTGDGVARLVGDVDAGDVARLVGLLAVVPHRGDLVVDVSGVEYLHHTVFAALEGTTIPADRVRLAAPRAVLRRVWDAVGPHDGRVVLD